MPLETAVGRKEHAIPPFPPLCSINGRDQPADCTSCPCYQMGKELLCCDVVKREGGAQELYVFRSDTSLSPTLRGFHWGLRPGQRGLSSTSFPPPSSRSRISPTGLSMFSPGQGWPGCPSSFTSTRSVQFPPLPAVRSGPCPPCLVVYA